MLRARRTIGPRAPAVVAALALALVVASPAARADSCPNSDQTPLAVGEANARAAMYCLINVERQKAGRSRLTVSWQLAAEGNTYAAQMVEQGFFSHVDPQGRGLVARTRASGYLTGYGVWALGENIGWGAGPLGSPQAMMEALMNSPGHRRNILSTRYRNMGVGVSTGIPTGGRFGATYVQQFGWRAR